jgi:hypothetical protein
MARIAGIAKIAKIWTLSKRRLSGSEAGLCVSFLILKFGSFGNSGHLLSPDRIPLVKEPLYSQEHSDSKKHCQCHPNAAFAVHFRY